MKSGIKLTGKYDLKLIRGGYIIRQDSGKNLVTDAGENLVAELLDHTTSPNEPEYMALGSGGFPPRKTDTVLQSEIAATRTATAGAVRTNNILLLPFSFTAAAPLSVLEIGIFNGVLAGDMFSRFLIQALDIATSDLIEVDWTLTISGVD